MQAAISHTATVASPRVSFTQFIALSGLFSGQLPVSSFSAPEHHPPWRGFLASSPGNIAALQTSHHIIIVTWNQKETVPRIPPRDRDLSQWGSSRPGGRLRAPCSG